MGRTKGAALRQLSENSERVTTPLYRAPYAKEWKKVSWDWALTEIAKKVKATRDASFEVKNAKGQVVTQRPEKQLRILTDVSNVVPQVPRIQLADVDAIDAHHKPGACLYQESVVADAATQRRDHLWRAIQWPVGAPVPVLGQRLFQSQLDCCRKCCRHRR